MHICKSNTYLFVNIGTCTGQLSNGRKPAGLQHLPISFPGPARAEQTCQTIVEWFHLWSISLINSCMDNIMFPWTINNNHSFHVRCRWVTKDYRNPGLQFLKIVWQLGIHVSQKLLRSGFQLSSWPRLGNEGFRWLGFNTVHRSRTTNKENTLRWIPWANYIYQKDFTYMQQCSYV